MSSDAAPTKYRRRHRWPILVAMVLLIGAGTAVWAQALKPAPIAAAGCNQPIALPSPSARAAGLTAGTSSATGTAATTGAATTSSTPKSTTGTTTGKTTGKTTTGKTTTKRSTTSKASTSTGTSTSSSTPTTIGQFTDPNVLADIRPANPALVPVRVLNASAVVGQAKTVTDELRSLGFASVLPQDNDPLYPAASYPQAALTCYGEIRFGNAGLAEARTVLLVAPCAQLVLDDRIDNSVDLSLGAKYQLTTASDEVKAQLTQIKNASVPPAVIEGQTQAPKPLPPIPDLPSTAGCPS